MLFLGWTIIQMIEAARGLKIETPGVDPGGLIVGRKESDAKWFFAVFGLSLAYAVARYHLVGDVAWRHLPLFILNKAISLAVQMR